MLVLPSSRRGQDLYAWLGYRYAGPYRNAGAGPELGLLLLKVGGAACICPPSRVGDDEPGAGSSGARVRAAGRKGST